MTFWKWSRTAANNGNADPTCPFPEGMSPSALNDGTRGMMAAAAKYRDDIAGAIVTTGTSTAYAISSYQGFDTLAHLDGQQIAFVPHATNTDKCTLAVDSLAVAPLHYAPGVELPTGTLVQGTPYVATYFAAANEFILRGLAGNPFNVPLGGMLPYITATPPNSSFVLPYGQNLSRTVYASLFAMIGTYYGAGDGTSTFKIPDLRGRVVVGQDNMGGVAANLVTAGGSGINGAVIGAMGGTETVTLQQGHLPAVTVGVSVSGNISVGSVEQPLIATISGVSYQAGSNGAFILNDGSRSYIHSGGINYMNGNTGNLGSSWGHQNMPPAIVLPMLLRVI